MTSLEITQDNVRDNTSSQINRLIDREIEASINSYKSRSKESIRARIEELDKEWDIERTLELNASVIAFSGITECRCEQKMAVLARRRDLLSRTACNTRLVSSPVCFQENEDTHP